MRPSTLTPTTGTSPVANTMDRFDQVLRREHERLPAQAASPHHRFVHYSNSNSNNNSVGGGHNSNNNNNNTAQNGDSVAAAGAGGSPSFEMPTTATGKAKGATPTAAPSVPSKQQRQSPHHGLSTAAAVAAAAGSPSHGPISDPPPLPPTGDDVLELQVLASIRQDMIQAALRSADMGDLKLSLAEQEEMYEILCKEFMSGGGNGGATSGSQPTLSSATAPVILSRPPLPSQPQLLPTTAANNSNTTAAGFASSMLSPSILQELQWAEGRESAPECGYRPSGGPLPPGLAGGHSSSANNNATAVGSDLTVRRSGSSLGTTPVGASQLSPMTFSTSPQPPSSSVLGASSNTPNKEIGNSSSNSNPPPPSYLHTPRSFSAQRKDGSSSTTTPTTTMNGAAGGGGSRKGGKGGPGVTKGLLSLSKKAVSTTAATTSTTPTLPAETAAAKKSQQQQGGLAYFASLSAVGSNGPQLLLQHNQLLQQHNTAPLLHPQRSTTTQHHHEFLQRNWKDLLAPQAFDGVPRDGAGMGSMLGSNVSTASSEQLMDPSSTSSRGRRKILKSASSAFSECSGGDISSSAPTTVSAKGCRD